MPVVAGTRIRRLRVLALLAAGMLSACASVPVMHPSAWPARLQWLQGSGDWDMQGRAAVAIGTRGWQASVDWRQRGAHTVVHLSGPLGIGASILALGPDGLSVNGAPPSRAGVEAMQRRLGFELPIANLRYWLLGVPDPDAPASVRFNPQDRLAGLTQAGWTVDFLRYRSHAGDWLPAALSLEAEGVRVRIVVDRWKGVR